MRSLNANIYYLYLIKLAKWLMLIMPIVVLFYTDNGLDTYHLYLLQSAYSLCVAFFEIPSGYMADIVGRRTTLIWGAVLGTLGFGVLSLSHTFTGFLAAEIILGLGGSFVSGADSALLYDSLAAQGKQNYYLRYEGRITALGNLGETVAAIGGGLIAAWFSYRSVYMVQTMVAAIGIPAALLLIEPARHKLIDRPSFSQIIKISRNSLFVDRKLSATILGSSVAGTATLCMAWTAQVYFVEQGFTEKEITPLWVLLNLTVALVSATAAIVVARLGLRKAVIITALLPAGFILLGVLPLIPAILCLFIFYLVRGYTTPMLRDLINRSCDSSIRATVLSIRSLIIRLAFAVGGPCIGFIAGRTTLSTALVLFGIALSILSFAATVYLFANHSLQTSEE